MKKKPQVKNGTVIVIGIGTVVILALLFVGFYGNNLTTKVNSGSQTGGNQKDCTTADKKAYADKRIKELSALIQKLEDSKEGKNKEIAQVRVLLLDAEKAGDKTIANRLRRDLKNLLRERESIETQIASRTVEMEEHQRTLNMPICGSELMPRPRTPLHVDEKIEPISF